MSDAGSRRVISFSQEVSSKFLCVPASWQLRVEGWVMEDMGGTGHRELYNSPHTPGAPTVSEVLLSQQCGVSPPHGGQLHTRTKAEGTDRLAESQAKPWTLIHQGRGALYTGERVPSAWQVQLMGSRPPHWASCSPPGRKLVAEGERHLDPSNSLSTPAGSVSYHPSPRAPAKSQVCPAKPQMPAPRPPPAPNQGRPARCLDARSS